MQIGGAFADMTSHPRLDEALVAPPAGSMEKSTLSLRRPSVCAEHPAGKATTARCAQDQRSSRTFKPGEVPGRPGGVGHPPAITSSALWPCL